MPSKTDWRCIAALTAIATLYFGAYYDHGFNYADEGSVVLSVQRLMDGDRPYVDLELGYGVLWYYPLVLLFKVTGVSFIAARVYFLGLAWLSAILGYLVVRKHSQSVRLGLTIGAIVLLFPGTLHKTYIPLLAIGNLYGVSVLAARRRDLVRWRLWSVGAVLAASYLVRPDVGVGILVCVLGAIVGWEVVGRKRVREKAGAVVRSLVIVGFGMLSVCAPVLVVAAHQGFLPQLYDFLDQPWDYAVGSFNDFTLWLRESWSTRRSASSSVSGVVVGADSGPHVQSSRTLMRAPLSAVFHGPQRAFALLTYLPLAAFTMSVIGILGRLRFACGVAASRDAIRDLALLGVAFSTFPQFFLFRPDINHLSQFMPGFFVFSGVFLSRYLMLCPREQRAMPIPAHRLKVAGIGLLIVTGGVFAVLSLRSEHSGSIALARTSSEAFHGRNGVRVRLSPRVKELFTSVTRAVEKHSDADDALLCFPFCPGFNLLTGRAAPMRRLYVDDLLLRMEPDWPSQTIDFIEAERVAIVIVQNKPINGTEISRFKNWASEVMAYLEEHYDLVERLPGTDIYVRRRSVQSQGKDRRLHNDSSAAARTCVVSPVLADQAVLARLARDSAGGALRRRA